MLISHIACVALLLSSGIADVSATHGVDSTAASEYSLYRPEDPSTLMLALIGAGTLALYFAFRRTVRSSRPDVVVEVPGPLAGSLSQAAVSITTEAAEEPSRGAA